MVKKAFKRTITRITETANLFLLKWSKKPLNALSPELQKLLIFFYSKGQKKPSNALLLELQKLLIFFYSNVQKNL